jgi:rhodanese-related sulfurtransferase
VGNYNRVGGRSISPTQKPKGLFLKRIVVLIFIVIPSILFAAQAPTVCHNELSSWIKAKQKLSIVDIQNAADFREHNYTGSLASDNDPLRLKRIAARLRSTKGKVIVVSATGGDNALQATELLVNGGVKRSRIMLLEGGMEAAAKNAACDCCKPSSLQNGAK